MVDEARFLGFVLGIERVLGFCPGEFVENCVSSVVIWGFAFLRGVLRSSCFVGLLCLCSITTQSPSDFTSQASRGGGVV